MPESARIGESVRYFVANQPMRYGIEIVYSLEVEHCSCVASSPHTWTHGVDYSLSFKWSVVQDLF